MVPFVNLLFAKHCIFFTGQKHRAGRLKFPEAMNKLNCFWLTVVLESESHEKATADTSTGPISRQNPLSYGEEPLTALQTRCQNYEHLNEPVPFDDQWLICIGFFLLHEVSKYRVSLLGPGMLKERLYFVSALMWESLKETSCWK